MRFTSYNIQIIKIKTAYYLQDKILDNFFKAIISQMITPIRITDFHLPPTLSLQTGIWNDFPVKVYPDLVNRILVTSKHYRCFLIHAHLRDSLHQAREF